MTITKADLANTLHENLGINKREALELVMSFFEEISSELERGDTVKLSGFGVFQVRAKRARMGRNPKTGEPASIDPRRVISFRASQVMKAMVGKAMPPLPAERTGAPIGIEATGVTLEAVAALDPAWIDQLKRLCAAGSCRQ